MRVSDFLPPQDAGARAAILRDYAERSALDLDLARHPERAVARDGAGEAIDLSFHDVETCRAARPEWPAIQPHLAVFGGYRPDRG